MVLKSTPGANIPTYQIAGSNASRIIPDWLIKKRKNSLKYDPEFASRLELIQDFYFEEASNRLKVTKDGQFCMATGTYKPQIHVYDFNQLSLKFDRHTDSENVDFLLLSDDWTKSVHLQNDRVIEFHAQGGIHHKTRIPKFGRSMAYNPTTCDIFVGASGNEVYRLNADQGRYLAPFVTQSEGVNALDINPAHGLLSFGMENGTVEFWDPRTRQRAAMIDVVNGQGIGSGVTAVKYRSDGLNFAAGTHEGSTLLYDIRSPEPLITKDQGYGFGIQNIEFIDTQSISDKILTSDKRIVKIWDRHDGEAFTSFEPSVDINDVAVIPDSGMIFLANEGKPMHIYYIPAIGPAPEWCSYLDNFTEENEDTGETSVYENFKFVTRKELSQLNLSHLIGSNVVKSYMHGYFINKELYDRARSISNPYAYREHRGREINKKIEQQRESRIRTAGAVGAKVKVNKGLAAEMAIKKGGSESAAAVVADDRFKAMFENPEFQVDESSRDFASKVKSADQAAAYRAGGNSLTAVEQEQLDDGNHSESESESRSESEKTEKQLRQERKKKQQEERRKKAEQRKKQEQEQQKVQMRAISKHTSKGGRSFGDQLEDNAVFEEMEEAEKATTKKSVRGDVELSYVPAKSKKTKKVRIQGEEDNDDEPTDSGRKRQRNEGLRRASKNTFRGM